MVLTLVLLVATACRTAKEPADEPPMYKTIAPAKTSELTRAEAPLDHSYFRSWSRSHGNAMSNRYSAYSQINRTNVAELRPAWTYRSKASYNLEANPIFADGMAIFPIPGNFIVAVDGMTGKEKWRFRTEGKAAFRGLVWWPGNDDTGARIFFPVGTNLYALTPSGQPVEDFGQGGVVRGDSYSLVAPAVVNGTIIYAVMGYPIIDHAAVEGIDAVSGRVLWHTPMLVPLDAKDRMDSGDYGGGNPWSGVAVDEARQLAYVTTGNPKPGFVGVDRPGNNEHTDSVVAIDTRSGDIVWSFQEIAHDIWDKDIAAPPILTQITRAGVLVDVVVALTKHGNTIVLDRVTGKPIFPWRLKRAPRSSLQGEKTAAYQPAVELPEPFSKQDFGEDDLTRLGAANHAFAKNILEQANSGAFPTFSAGKDTIYYGLRGGAEWPGGAVDPDTHVLFVCSNDVPWRIRLINVAGLDQLEFPDSRPRERYLEHCASCHGQGLQGSGRNPALYGIEERRGEAFISRIIRTGRRGMPSFARLPAMVRDDIVAYIRSVKPDFDQQKRALEENLQPNYQFTGWRIFRDNEGYPASQPPWGWLNALDLNSGRMLWRVPLGTDKTLEARGLKDIGTENLGGPVVTAGHLVFVTGTTDNFVRAFDEATGRELWRYELPFMGSAPPAVYMAGGKEYLLVAATGGTLDNPVWGNAYVAFSLP